MYHFPLSEGISNLISPKRKQFQMLLEHSLVQSSEPWGRRITEVLFSNFFTHFWHYCSESLYRHPGSACTFLVIRRSHSSTTVNFLFFKQILKVMSLYKKHPNTLFLLLFIWLLWVLVVAHEFFTCSM